MSYINNKLINTPLGFLIHFETAIEPDSPGFIKLPNDYIDSLMSTDNSFSKPKNSFIDKNNSSNHHIYQEDIFFAEESEGSLGDNIILQETEEYPD